MKRLCSLSLMPGTMLILTLVLSACRVPAMPSPEGSASLPTAERQTPAAPAHPKFLGNIYYRYGNFEPMNFAKYWNQVTPENFGKWGEVEKQRDQYSWDGLDSAYNFAKSQGFPFKEHTLIWGNQQPKWICGLSEEEQKEEVEEWIKDVCTRYPDLDMVDVVNEPLHAPPCYKDAIGGDGTTGWDWVIWAFQTAGKYCSGVKILNDYGILNSSTNTEKLINIARILKDKGIPVAIGCQGHGLEKTGASTIRANLDKIAEAGFPVYISEYDVDIADDAQQLKIYQEQFPLFWEHPVVKGVTLWGYVEGEIWKRNAYLLRADGTERPALTWLMEYIRGAGIGTGK